MCKCHSGTTSPRELRNPQQTEEPVNLNSLKVDKNGDHKLGLGELVGGQKNDAHLRKEPLAQEDKVLSKDDIKISVFYWENQDKNIHLQLTDQDVYLQYGNQRYQYCQPKSFCYFSILELLIAKDLDLSQLFLSTGYSYWEKNSSVHFTFIQCFFIYLI